MQVTRMREAHRLNMDPDPGWYIIAPMWLHDRMVARYGSIEAALETVQRLPDPQMPLVSVMTGAVGIEFVGGWTDEMSVRYRFPWI